MAYPVTRTTEGVVRYTHDNGDGTFTTYERSGTCIRCGECCESGDPFNGEMGEPVIEGACPLLALLPDGTHACTDRTHPYYLNGCNVWPTHPNHIQDYRSCSYKFRIVDGS